MAQLIHGTTIAGHEAIHLGNMPTHGIATTSYVTTQINNLINGAPGALDTLNELAAALGNNANFASAVTDSLAGKLSLTGGTMTGTITITNTDIRSNASSGWTGDPGAQGKIQYHANRWYIVADQSSDRIVQFRRNSTDVSHVDNSGVYHGNITGSAGSVAWTNVSSRPTALSQFTNDLGNYGGFLTSLPSHNHDDRYYTETESDGRYLRYRGINQENDFQRFQDSAGEIRFDQIDNYGNLSNPPSGYQWGGVLSMRGENFGFQLWGSHTGDFFYKTQWNNDQHSGWRQVITSMNIGSQSVNYAASAGSVAWGNISGLPSTFPPTAHTHDDRYYTESESDSRFVNASGDSMSGSLTMGAGAAYVGTHGDWTGEQNKIQWHSTHLYLQNTAGGNFFFRRADGTNLFNLDNNGSLIISGDFYPNSQGTYRLYVANSGLWTNGNFGASGDLYLGTRGTWLSSWLNQNVQTGASPSFANVYVTGIVGNNSSQTRDKLRVWDSSEYTIGMKNGYSFGHIASGEYAMSFQMNNNSGRGFWWGDTAHNDAQGAAALTTDGRMNIARSLSIGEGESATEPSSAPLYVRGQVDNAEVLAVDGVNGRLFTVTDSVLDTIYSVNTIAGLPILEVLADSSVKIGKYGANSITISNSRIAINSDTVDTNFPFYVSDRTTATNRYTLANPGMGFNLSDNYAQLQLYGPAGAYIDFATSANDHNGRIIWGSSRFTITGAMWGDMYNLSGAPYATQSWVQSQGYSTSSSGISQAAADARYQPLENQRLSTGNGPTFAQVYTNGWFRNNNANEGLYNQTTGTHFYSSNGSGWTVTGSGGNIELVFRSNHQSTIRGYVYADTGNNIGFLNNGGGWSLRTDSSSNAQLYGSDFTIGLGGAGATNIIMKDSDEGDRVIHCNSNRIGFLNQSGSWGAWCDDSGNWITGAGMYAAAFYDNDNSAFYVNPGGSSRIRNLYIGDSGSDWSDPGGWGTQLHVSHGPHSIIRVYTRNEAIETVLFSHGGGQSKVGSGTNHNFSIVRNFSDRMVFYSGYTYSEGYLQAADSLRAPIFYDSNNTGYYIDPDSRSNIWTLTANGKEHYFGTSSGWDGAGFGSLTNVHMQGHSMFWFGAGNAYWWNGAISTEHDLLITTMYGYDTKAYYRGITFAVDNNGNGNTGGYRLGRWQTYGTGWNTARLQVDASLSVGYGNRIHGGSYNEAAYPLDRGVWGHGRDQGGYGDDRVRSKLFSPTANGGGPWGSFASLEVSSVLDGNNDIPALFRMHQWGSGSVEFWKPQGRTLFIRESPGGGGSWFDTLQVSGTLNVTSNQNTSGTTYAAAYRGNANVGGTGEATWHPAGAYVGGTMWQYGAMYKNNTDIYDIATAYASGSFRAPIFYDSADTGYYVDPNSTSNLWKFSEATLNRNSLNSKQVNSPWETRANQGALYQTGAMGWGTTDFNVIGSNWGSGFFDTWSWPGNRPNDASGHWVGLQAFHYNNSDSSRFHGWQMACAQEANNRWFWRSAWDTPRAWVEMIHSGNIGSQSVNYAGSAGSVAWDSVSGKPGIYLHNTWHGNTYIGTGGDIYCTILYDSNNSAYYLDPNGSSRLNEVYANHLRTYGNGRVDGNLYLDQQYGSTIVGVYESTRLQGVWAMGDAYKIAMDGTNAGNLYGLAWSHPNAGGQAGFLSDHGLIHMMYGTAFATISSNIWCRGDIIAFSDARVKTNIQRIENPIDKIMAIRGVTFTRTDIQDKEKRHAGVIAQEVLEVLPEVVNENKDSGHYSVAYGNLSALLIEAIKEQQQQIEELKAEVKKLRGE